MTTKRPALWITTGDPIFNPQGGAFINGYAFVPLAAVRELIKATEEEYDDTFLAGREAALDAVESFAPLDPIAVAPAGAKPTSPPMRDAAGRVLVETPHGGRRYVAPPRPGFAAGYPKSPCNVRAEGDEFVCASCALRWARDEERPECPNDKGNEYA